MRQSELEKQNIVNEHGKFVPSFTYSSFEIIEDEKGNEIDREYVDCVITSTAEEQYNSFLNPSIPVPTIEEQLKVQAEAIATLMEVLASV